MQMQGALWVLGGAARKVLAGVGRRRWLERVPLPAFVECDFCAQPRRRLARAWGSLVLVIVISVDLLVGNVDAFDALKLLEVAPTLRVPLVVAQGEGEAEAFRV